MAAARFIVRGKVQGVGFRAATRRHAAGLGIHHGHAINRADGDVEVGEAEQPNAAHADGDAKKHGKK